MAAPRLKGGLRTLAMVTVPERDWDELGMEAAVLRYEARAHLARLAPLHVRLYSYATALGPAAEQTVAAAIYECQRYGRKNGVGS